MSEEDPTTQELRLEQLRREATERERAGVADEDDEADQHEAEQHERRADKAGYLRRKLEERAEAERRAGLTDEED